MYVLFSYVSQGLCTLTLGSTASSSWGWKGKGQKNFEFFLFLYLFQESAEASKIFQFLLLDESSAFQRCNIMKNRH